MRGMLAMVAIAGAAHGAFAQGTLLFDNNNSGLIEIQAYGTSSLVPVSALGESQKNPGNATWNVALLYAPSLDTLNVPQSAFIGTAVADYIPDATLNPGFDGDGSFQDGTGDKEATITVPFITQNTFAVVSWLGTATTWYGALAGGATYTASVEFLYTPANSGAMPVPAVPISINSAGAWDGNLDFYPLPEPSSFALGGLGAAMLFLFRRRFPVSRH